MSWLDGEWRLAERSCWRLTASVVNLQQSTRYWAALPRRHRWTVSHSELKLDALDALIRIILCFQNNNSTTTIIQSAPAYHRCHIAVICNYYSTSSLHENILSITLCKKHANCKKYTVSQVETRHLIFHHNFGKWRQIFKILSILDYKGKYIFPPHLNCVYLTLWKFKIRTTADFAGIFANV